MEAGITDETWATDLKILNHYKACMDQVGYYLLFIENLKARLIFSPVFEQDQQINLPDS